jgi:hypothetical protein
VQKSGVFPVLFAMSLLVPSTASADTAKRVGGHVGAVVPLVTRSGGQSVAVSDDFVVGFPTGVKVAKVGRFVIDFEAVPGYQNEPSNWSLELHPGVVTEVGDKLAAGMRVAFDVEGNSWGLTPLVNRTVYVASTHSLFVEAVVPVRFPDQGSKSVGFAVHVGVGF